MSRTAVFRWCSDFRHGRVSTGACHDQVKYMWFGTQPKTFFADGIHRLVDQWDTCFNQQGDYV
jgi:phage terminase large subunit-like protein